MMRNKEKMPITAKTKILQKQTRLDFYLTYMAPSYFLGKNSYMYTKFFRKFFSFHFFFFKKLWFFAKTFATGHAFYRSFLLEQKKYVFGNCFKFSKNYQISEHDEFFFFLKKKKIRVINNIFFKTPPVLKGFHSNFFFVNYSNLVNLPESYDNLENFFYKSEIYMNWLNPNYNEDLNTFLDNFSFDFTTQYNLFFVLEIYKIHIHITLKNLLIILYFYLKKKALPLGLDISAFYQRFY